MEVLNLLLIFSISFVGALTPGPDLLFILRNTLLYGAKKGFFSWLGIFVASSIYLFIAYQGLLHFLQSPLVQMGIGILGGFYLLYISYQLLQTTNTIDLSTHQNSTIPPSKTCFIKGFIINISNPKFIIFVISILVPTIGDMLEIGLIVFIISSALAFWLVILVASFFRKIITNHLFNWIDKICGVLFIIFALLLFYSSYLNLIATLPQDSKLPSHF
ncbi:LysE family translocator [Helicobacter monodelphidis]|uniref:LysE family translocator n=1 Tax=Helicobacter sp. 15-1451 TaxID=2004995 RepID=UPI0015EBACCB|nr:LysE family translocator [Helicobacter sp. 15-1451]